MCTLEPLFSKPSGRACSGLHIYSMGMIFYFISPAVDTRYAGPTASSVSSERHGQSVMNEVVKVSNQQHDELDHRPYRMTVQLSNRRATDKDTNGTKHQNIYQRVQIKTIITMLCWWNKMLTSLQWASALSFVHAHTLSSGSRSMPHLEHDRGPLPKKRWQWKCLDEKLSCVRICIRLSMYIIMHHHLADNCFVQLVSVDTKWKTTKQTTSAFSLSTSSCVCLNKIVN